MLYASFVFFFHTFFSYPFNGVATLVSVKPFDSLYISCSKLVINASNHLDEDGVHIGVLGGLHVFFLLSLFIIGILTIISSILLLWRLGLTFWFPPIYERCYDSKVGTGILPLSRLDSFLLPFSSWALLLMRPYHEQLSE